MLFISVLTLTFPLSITGAQARSGLVSKNARCGLQYGGQTCQGSVWGNCCSRYGYCGSTIDYCNASTCQKGYGSCNGASSAHTTLRSTTVPSLQRESQSAAIVSTITVTATASTSTVTQSVTSTILTTITEPTTVLSTVTEPTTILSTLIQPATIISTLTEPKTILSTLTEPTTILSTVTELTTILSTVTEPTTLTITTIPPSSSAATSSSTTQSSFSSSAAPLPTYFANGDFETGIGTNTTGSTIPGWINPIGTQATLKQRMEIQSNFVYKGSGALILTQVPTTSNSLLNSPGYMYLIPSVKPTLSPSQAYTFSAYTRQLVANACKVTWYCGITAVGSTTLNAVTVTPSAEEWTQTTFSCQPPAAGSTHIQLTTVCAAGNPWTQVYIDEITLTANA
ncbi:hypothetical protein CC78DRAFT_577195 [Lojkania enalia]|uniref:Chitin-binding type-1 domain-containing protein n=1 Tax=Lojkania enalia TaxID=147567 RepID=A0A9P4KGW7_9PLEO|nr:hypothetical protein CC78DRAFT_577195 [Didymosphaeria enalia]